MEWQDILLEAEEARKAFEAHSSCVRGRLASNAFRTASAASGTGFEKRLYQVVAAYQGLTRGPPIMDIILFGLENSEAVE